MKNPQTTFAPTFLTHIISRIDGVYAHPLAFSYLKQFRDYAPALQMKNSTMLSLRFKGR